MFPLSLRLMLAMGALAVAVAVGLPEPAAAQNFPPGSWRQSCKDARMEGRDDLVAECRRRDGSYNRSRIDTDRCGRGGAVANNNGNLVCENANAGNNNQRLPPGSWAQSCRNARMEGRDDLVADCRRRDGGYNRSRIDIDRCGRGGAVANNNGNPVCENANAGGGGNWWGNKPPQGSYRQSCRNERMQDRDLLVAECRRNNGNYRNTRLDIDSCRGRDIVNDNGHLECGGRGYGNSYGGKLPPGSWSQSCRNARIVRDDLYAECRQRDGDWVRSSIDLDDCRGQSVRNDNGRLRCGNVNYGGDRFPNGPWRDSCRNPRMEGDRFIADCRELNGGWNTDGIGVSSCRGRPIYNQGGKLRC